MSSDRTRIFIVCSYLIDDNDESVTDPVPICGTKSKKVAKKAIEVLLKHNNHSTTFVWLDEVKRVLPELVKENLELSPLLQKMVGEEEDSDKNLSPELGGILSMVDVDK